MRNSSDETPLHYAIMLGNREAVKRLVAADREVLQASRHEHDPLYIAAVLGDIDMVRLLVELGADTARAVTKGVRALDSLCAHPPGMTDRTVAGGGSRRATTPLCSRSQ